MSLHQEICIVALEADAKPNVAERYWIAHFRNLGNDLTNLTDGGEGTFGCKWTADQRARHGSVMKARTMNDEWRNNISAATRGKPKPAGFGAKVGAALTGIKRSMETKRKVGAASLGRRFSMPENAKKRIADAKRQWWAERKSCD